MGKNRKVWMTCLVVLVFICSFGLGETHDVTDDEDEDPAVTFKDDMQDNGFDIEYTTPVPITEGKSVYFWENFDDPDLARKRWQKSGAQKEGQDGVSKYDGEWVFEVPQKVIFNADSALVLKSKAKHAAIAARLDHPFDFRTNPLFVQYEVTFQNGMDCGGAYIKLLSQSQSLELNKFTDKTPYTIMFGPDKCGNDYKLHFIFRHKNPINGTFEEKHAKKPTSRLEENYTDKKPHVYLLKLFPDNTFQVYVDGSLVNSGSLLTDMTPPVNPPQEIPDASDTKPSDWDERENIPDVSVRKPEDWDDDAPAKIHDPEAVMPSGWLEEEEMMIPDETATKPEDWDESMDGEWEPPLKNNPVCEGTPGCGLWSAPMIDNPNFKGRWKQPLMSNPNYKGKWLARNIPNPDYFDDKEPFKMTPIGAVGIEIWAMTDLILFDNFLITDSEKVLADWTSKTYDLKKKAIDKDSKSWYGKLMRKINYHIGVWTGYFIYCSIPILCYIFYLWKMYHDVEEDKRDEFSNKKTDEFVDDVDEDAETEADAATAMTSNASTPSSSRARKSVEKETLEVAQEVPLEEIEEDEDQAEEDEHEGTTTEDSSSGDDMDTGEFDGDGGFQYAADVQPDSGSGEGDVKKRKPRRE